MKRQGGVTAQASALGRFGFGCWIPAFGRFVDLDDSNSFWNDDGNKRSKALVPQKQLAADEISKSFVPQKQLATDEISNCFVPQNQLAAGNERSRVLFHKNSWRPATKDPKISFRKNSWPPTKDPNLWFRKNSWLPATKDPNLSFRKNSLPPTKDPNLSFCITAGCRYWKTTDTSKIHTPVNPFHNPNAQAASTSQQYVPTVRRSRPATSPPQISYCND